MPKVVANVALTSAGYLPAAIVAVALGKSVSTLHRMVDAGRVAGVRDGRILYLNMLGLVAYYRASGAEPVAKALLELTRRFQEEARTAAPALERKKVKKQVARAD